MTHILLTEKSLHKILNDIDNRLIVKEIKETEKPMLLLLAQWYD
jgi:hypothetical protein